MRERQNRVRIGQRFRLNEAVEQELSGISRKYSNFSGKFEFADFSAMLEVLSAGVACYSLYGSLNHNDMMAGMPLSIRALSTYDDPVGASEKSIFIPRSVSTTYSRGTFSALVCAANMVGTTVATDVVHLDANSNSPVVTMVDGAELALGCYDAIRLLLGVMEDSQAGAMGVYAVTRGIHVAMTVVAHTDEGGYMRKVFRSEAFAPSFGGIYAQKERTYCGIPFPSKERYSSFIALTDGMALATAGLVANCDPLIEYKGRWYPTIYGAGELSRCNSVKANEDSANNIGMKIASTCGTFSTMYAEELARLFGIMAGDVGPVVAHMQACFNWAGGSGDRHLAYTSVAPFYWIEPTSLFKVKGADTIAVREGYGTLVGVFETSAMPYFEGLAVVNAGSESSSIIAGFRGARTCGAVLHHAQNVNNGLGAIVIRQASAISFAHRGGTDEPIDASMQRSAPLSDYLWGRGDAGVPAPSELLYTDKAIGLIVQHGKFDHVNFEYKSSGIADQRELASNIMVKLTTNTPAYYGIKKMYDRPRKMLHSRSMAVAALETVKGMFAGGHRTGGDSLALSFSAPDIVFDRDVDTRLVVNQVSAPAMPATAETAKRGPTTQVVVEQLPIRPMRPHAAQAAYIQRAEPQQAMEAAAEHGILQTEVAGVTPQPSEP